MYRYIGIGIGWYRLVFIISVSVWWKLNRYNTDTSTDVIKFTKYLFVCVTVHEFTA